MADTELIVTDRYSIHRNLAAVYGTLIVSLGIAIPMSSAFARGSGFYDSQYVEVFQGYLYLVSAAGLLYVFLYLLRGPQDSISNLDGREKSTDIPMESTRGSKNGQNPSVRAGSSTPLSVKESGDRPRVHYGGEGITVYLRIAAVVFALGAFLYDGFNIAEYVQETANGCRSHVPIVSTAIHFLFLVIQTVFIVGYDKIVVTANTRLANKVFMHLMVTNICVFFTYSVMDTAEDFSESTEKDGNGTEKSDESKADCYSLATIFDQVSPYLYPFVLEYSVIGATLMYIIFTTIGSPPEDEDHKTSIKSSWHNPSTGGAFTGALVAMVTFGGLAYFLYTFSDDEETNNAIGVTIYLSLELFLLLTCCITVLVALCVMKKAVFLGMETDTMDDNLLFIATFGAYLQLTFIGMPLIWFLSEGYPLDINVILALILVILGITQATLQTAFLGDTGRRDPEVKPTARSVPHKKGRGLLVFLSACNLCLWLVNTFGAKRAGDQELFNVFYGTLAWKIVHNLTTPIIIFFRIHSTAMISDLWGKTYVNQE